MRSYQILLSAFVLIVLVAFPLAARAQNATPAETASFTVVASGLTNPRGFAWGPDGMLHLAMAGHGGDNLLPVAPGFTIHNGLTSSVVTVADGCTTPVVRGLVSTLWEEPGWVWGAMDVAFLGDDLYVLVSGAGPFWGSPSSRSGVYTIAGDGAMTLVADLGAWLAQHPPKVISPEPNTDGSLFDLEATSDALLISNAVSGQIIKVTSAGEISEFADLSEGHPVPTGLAVDADGNAYVGFESAAPFTDGGVTIVKIASDGTVSDAWTGLTRVADIAIGPDGTLYAEELSTGNTLEAPYTYPDTGRIVRQTGLDASEVIAEGLNYPVGLGFGPDGALYLSGPASGANNGEGWLARVEMGSETGAATAAGASTCEAMATPSTS